MTSDWLGSLEDRVRDAAEELRRLREENGELRARVASLEAEESASPPSGEWLEERDAIRQRVERLVEQLEGLLED